MTDASPMRIDGSTTGHGDSGGNATADTSSQGNQGLTTPCPPNVSTTAEATTKGRKRSWVWEHFTMVGGGDSKKARAACKYCGTDYAATSANGTKNLIAHILKQCKKYPNSIGKSQSTLAFEYTTDGGSGDLFAVPFSVEDCRRALVEMVILDELPFRIVEGEGFKRFVRVVCPKWTTNKIPSRMAIARDCFNVFLREKKKLGKALRGQRICLTTDTWTSVQNLNYMCLTAHFIDDNWTLHKRIINFCVVDNHKGVTLGRAVESCLFQWKLKKILTLTVDNASSNSSLIEFLKDKTKEKKDTLLENEFLHVRCYAHILNLIVHEGLKELDESIAKIRNVVRYVRSSPQRWSKLQACAERETISSKSQPCLDVPTRWDFTYMMLDKAQKFRKAFERLEEVDKNFLPTLREGEEDEDGDDGNCGQSKKGKKVFGAPEREDWIKVRLFVKFLQLFYDAALRFSGSKAVTANQFVPELMLIRDTIEEECLNENESLKKMAMDMKSKFNKYWENLDNQNLLLYVAVVLDPRYKLRYVHFAFKGLYHDISKVDEKTEQVKDALVRMYEAYLKNEKGRDAQNNMSTQLSQGSSGSSSSGPLSVRRSLRMAQFMREIEEENSFEKKSEVERYLEEGLAKLDGYFDILNWWKANSCRFPVLSLVARHVLAIPVSTVASESAFSLEGRVLDPFRSSLSPRMVEGLLCAQDWLRSSSTPISLQKALEDVEEFEKLDSELGELTIADEENPNASLVKQQQQQQQQEVPTLTWPENSELDLDWIENLISTFDWSSKNLPPSEFQSVLPVQVFNTLILAASKILHKEPNCLTIDPDKSSTVVVVGDIHGQMHDLIFLLKQAGFPSQNQFFVFNGNYVDHGAWGLETFLLLLAWKVFMPDRVFLLRGNHESKHCTSVYGFEKEVLTKYGEKAEHVYQKCLGCFEGLPLASIIAGCVFTAHGGLFRSIPLTQSKTSKGKKKSRKLNSNSEPESLSLGSLEELSRARRFVLDPPVEGLNLIPGDVLWSDPSMTLGLSLNKERNIGLLWGPDCTEDFLKKFNLKLIIRSHEGPDVREKRTGFGGMDEGYTIDHVVESGKLITVFSAPDYPQFQATEERYKNKGAYIVLEPPNFDNPTFYSFEAIAPRPQMNAYYDYVNVIDSNKELDLASMDPIEELP